MHRETFENCSFSHFFIQKLRICVRPLLQRPAKARELIIKIAVAWLAGDEAASLLLAMGEIADEVGYWVSAAPRP